jgi:hypothetical protein
MTKAEIGSVRWAVEFGERSATVIRSIRSGGYTRARRFYSFYSDGRTAHGAALRALSTVKKLGNPAPYELRGNVLWALDVYDTFKKKTPAYIPMRHMGPNSRLVTRRNHEMPLGPEGRAIEKTPPSVFSIHNINSVG